MLFGRYLTIFLVMVALVSWLTSHAEESTKGDEMNEQGKTYDLSGFTGVYASAAVDVELTQGDAFSVVAYTESGDFSGLELRVEDGVLIATRPEEIWKGENTSGWRRFFDIGSNGKNISVKRVDGQRVIKINGERVPTYTVRVTAPSIDRLGASSSSIVTTKGIKTLDLAIKTSTSGNINAEVTSSDVSVDASTSGDVILSGTCDNLDIKASTSGDVKASDLTAQQSDLRASTSGNIRATVSGGNVSVDASTSGDVILSGTCDNLDAKASTSGEVKANDLTCQNGNLRASSGADISVTLTETVSAHASSGGDILVRGGAKPVKVKESSGGDVSIRD